MHEHEAAFAKRRSEALPYRLLLPDSSPPPGGHPLVLFLHGAGERGVDNEQQLRHGVTLFSRSDVRREHPCVVVAPQCPPGLRWVEVPWDAPGHEQPAAPSRPLAQALALIEALQRELPVDPQRLYVTGVSMGGYGTWDAITRHPDLFAAAAPVCGGGDEALAPRISSLPIWSFHGAADPVVPVQRTRAMIAALRRAGGRPAYTEYAGVGHDCWTLAYEEPGLLGWLFSQRKPGRA